MILYVFCEGIDDSRFFEVIIKPWLSDRYLSIIPIEYSNKKKDKIDSFIKSILSANDDYLFIADLDHFPHKTPRKSRLCKTYCKLNKNKIILVIKEIEGWYLAGINESTAKKLKIKKLHYNQLNPNFISKEQFMTKIKPENRVGLDFKEEILKEFDIQYGCKRNDSLEYLRKELLIIF